MSIEDVQRRQQILQELKRRRNRELIAFVPFVAALLVVYQAFDDPGLVIGGLRGLPLFLAAFTVVAACLVHHAVNWRCPACRHHFRSGISVPFCKSCGFVFEESKGQLFADPAVERREQVERAVQIDAGQYRGKYALQLIKALVIVGLGLLMALVLADQPGAARPDGWLYRTFGESGAHTAMQAIGGFITLLGLAWAGYAVYRLTAGARRRTEKVRNFLKS
jgi:rubredoxin